MKEKLFLDIEVYKNYVLIKFMNEEGKTRKYEISEYHQPPDIDSLRRLMNTYTSVTFNGNNYDIPILSLIISNPGITTEDIKEASDSLIVDGLKPWNFYTAYKCRKIAYDIIDIQEVAPGVMVSLKLYGGRMHMPKMQDLPYDPDKLLTFEEMCLVDKYCSNDLETTIKLYKEVEQRVDLRERMSSQYGTDLRSKSDAQVAEAVIASELFKTSGKRPSKPEVKEVEFFYKVPGYMRFETDRLKSVLEMVERSPFVSAANGIKMTDELASTLITIGDSTYKLGIGGLHSQESEQSLTGSVLYRNGKIVSYHEDCIIVDRDVTSYYPSIILNQRLYPSNLGEGFLQVYESLVARRIEAKRKVKELKSKGLYTVEEQKQLKDKIFEYFRNTDPKEQAELDRAVTAMDALRITINGAFGKLGSPYSKLYSPDLMVQVTMTGQLTLLMLIERLELAGVPVISANTDGLVSYYPRSRIDEIGRLVNDFEKETGFQFEDTEYISIHSRDVNNYIAIKTDGKVKTKGTFSPGGLMKNPEMEICNDALVEFLRRDGIFNTNDYIRSCKDIRKFLTIRTVRGGGVFNNGNEQTYLGKVVRWYKGKDSIATINYKTSGNKVPKSDGAIPVMDLPGELPSDIDYTWYANEVNELLQDIGMQERPPKLRKTRTKK